jgi:hypothetical protein
VKIRMTAAKKPSQTFQLMPVFCAITSILFIVLPNRSLVRSNESFIFSASADESLISSPIATVIYVQKCQLPQRIFSVNHVTYILQNLNLP